MPIAGTIKPLQAYLCSFNTTNMQIEIITIGDEILIGQVIDSNSAWLASELNGLGIRVSRITAIGDDPRQIRDAIDAAFVRGDAIVTTGGLGPTRDDLTKQVLCDYFETRLVFVPEALDNIHRLFGHRGVQMTEADHRQAMLPEKAVNFPNPEGTAWGMWFRKKNKHLFSLPGVPFEMKAIFTHSMRPVLYGMTGHQAIVHKTVMTTGIGESALSAIINDWETALPDTIKLAYLPSPGIVRLRLSAFGNDTDDLRGETERQVSLLKKIIPTYIYGFDDESLQETTGKLLLRGGFTLSTAESCTGGYIAHLITSVPGCSAWFKGSVVAYANDIKSGVLGVQADTLITEGAVSEKTVLEMANGIRQLYQTDFGLAISGIAGPDGGTVEKPAGLAWIALAGPAGALSREFRFGKERSRNITRSALAALNLLRQELIRIQGLF